jgi:hypothetical protein
MEGEWRCHIRKEWNSYVDKRLQELQQTGYGNYKGWKTTGSIGDGLTQLRNH